MYFKVFFNKFKEIDDKKLNRIAGNIAKRNNKSVASVKKDMIKNFLKYKIGYTDYMKSDFINLTDEEKKNHLTSKNYITILNYLNKKEYVNTMRDKILFNKIFKNYIKRDWIDLRTSSLKEFKEFIKDKDIIFGKIQNGFGSHGIRKIIVKDIDNVEKLYKSLKDNKQILVEEGIIQHPTLNKFNPYAVDTLRIITLLDKEGKPHIIGNAFRININDDEAISCFDAFMKIDENGNLISNCVDDNEIIYKEHPNIKIKFNTLKVPFAKEAFKMVKEAAKVVPEIRYVGWDVAITKDGPQLLEGNEYPSYGLVQYYLITKKRGHLEDIKDVLKDEFDNIKL